MANLKSNHFELNTITIGKKLNFAYQYDSANLEDKIDKYTYSSFEDWHPDFNELIKEAVELYASKLGFDPENWLAFQPKKIYLKGLLLKIDFDIMNQNGDEFSVKGVFIERLGETSQEITGEALAYINGKKRKQGDLFDREDTMLGLGDMSEFEDSEEEEDPEPVPA